MTKNKNIISIFLLLLFLSVIYLVFIKKANEVIITDFLNSDFNDQLGIQEAIDYAEKNKIGIVYFPKGKYIVNSPILIGSNLTIKLDEEAIIYRNFSGNGSSNATFRNKNMHSNGNSNITIQGGTIKAVNKEANGKHIAFWGVNSLKIEDLKIRNTYGDWSTIFRDTNNVRISNIDIDTKTDQIYTDGIHFVGGSNISISKCKVISGDDAIAFTIENKEDTDIKNVNVTDCDLTSRRASIIKMMTTSASYGTIKDISIKNINGTGGTVGSGQAVFLEDRSNSQRIQDITLDNVKINASKGSGYGGQINSLSNLKISNSVVSNSDGTGLVIQNSHKIAISSVNIFNPRSDQANGISIDNTKDVTLSDVVIMNPQKSGVLINNNLNNVENIEIKNLQVNGNKKANITIQNESNVEVHQDISNFKFSK